MENKDVKTTDGAEEERQKAEGTEAQSRSEESAENVVNEETQAGAETAAASEDEGEEGTEGKIEKDQIPGLSESAQEKVNERIHEINIRRKDAEAKLAERETELTETKERLKSLESLSDEQLVNVARRVGVLPQFLEKEEVKVIEEYENLKGYRSWLRQHRAGYEGTGDKDPGMTEDQVVDAELKVEDRLEEIGAKARSAKERAETKSRDVFMAGLKVMSAQKAKMAGKKITPPPVLPSGKGGARTPPIGGGAKPKEAFNQEEFIKEGGNSSALEKQYLKMLG